MLWNISAEAKKVNEEPELTICFRGSQDLILHTSGRGFLGFKRTDVLNDMNVMNRTWNIVNLDYSMMLPDVTQTHLEGESIYARTRYFYTFKYVSQSYYTNRRFFVKTDRVHTKNWLTNEAHETLNTYDDYGNTTASTVNTGVSDDFNISPVIETAVTNTIYATYAGAPYPGFPTSVVAQKTRTGQPQISKTTNYTYTANGLVQSATDFAGTALATTVTNTYNTLGLPTQVTTSAPGVTTPVIQYVYDSKGLFVLEKKVTGSGITKKETATYDERWQQPLSQTTTDGLTTTYQYNTFGELIQTNLPDGNSIVTTKSWETSGNFRYSTLTRRTDGTKPLKVYSDILGRDIKTEERAYSNNWLTSTKTYNTYGQLVQETVPYYTSEPINTKYYSYDSYGRLTTATNNTGSVTTTYTRTGNTAFTVKTTNAAGQWTSKTTDASGAVVSSSDNGQEMQFTYDSWGNQLTASSNGKTFVTNAYDNYGRKTSVTDINAGAVSYEYDALGRVKKQTDAKSQVQNTTYDVFGRVTTETGTQGTTTYTYYYDAATQKSNDNITQITGFSGDVRNYQYDNLQRLSTESLVYGGSTITKSYTYDAKGNLATTTYPAGFTIRNQYNDDDVFLFTKYEEGGSSQYLYVTMSMNSRGVPTGYLIQNKYSNTEYDFSKEAITRFNTGGVLDLSLQYQPYTLNLLSRKDNIRNITEIFTYDTYDRLTSAKVNGVQQFAITYDNGGQGKIMQKTDIGNYSYDANKIHQLKYLTSISNGANPSVVIGTSERNISYTSFLKTATITENNYQLTYTYGSDRQRIKSELKQNGSTIETKLYWGDMELVTKGGVTSEIYYISGPAGLSNIIVKKNGVITRYNAYTDQLGSILAVTDASGGLVAEQNFDAWGRKRNPANWSYTGVPTTPDWLYRGYTGHEHVAAFNLINMNGRMYDPMTGLMLSPDNYVPMPFSPGGYNRYLYANGNPLKFVDPDGEFFWIPIAIGAVIGGYSGYKAAKAHGATGWSMFGYIVGGTVIGGTAGWAGGAVAGAIGQNLAFAGAGTVAGSAGGFVAGVISGGGFAALGGGNIVEGIWKGALSGLVGGGVGAYIGGGLGAFAGGSTSGGLSTVLYGGNWDDFIKGALVGGAIAWSGYQLQQAFAYRQYNKGSKPFGYLTRQGFRKISVASQRSFARGKEAGGWILDDGNVGKIIYGDRDGINNFPKNPGNGIANFHTHPNDPGTIQFHSTTDLDGEKNVNYVIGWSEIYKNNPTTHPLPSNYRAFSLDYIYGTLIPSLITTYPNELYLYPYYWNYFGR